MNYFELLKMPQVFNIDINMLNKQYLTMQKLYHPDNNSTKQVISSIDLNNAYLTLNDEINRAEYLLSLHNININNIALSAGELNDILEESEFIESLTDHEILHNKYEKYIMQKKLYIKALEVAFDDNDFKKFTEITIKLKYLNRLIINVKHKLKSNTSN